jgi:predicted metal-dependent HD superfamily phosphohydrolase
MTVTVDMVAGEVLADLRNRHAEPQRHYHTWDHIQALLGWFGQRRSHLHDPAAVELAILFHDAVYDPARSDNEAESARLLMDADLPGLDDAVRARAVRMIEATARHEIRDGLDPADQSDMAEFLDMDLSILGARPEVFDAYEQAIRREYAYVPEPLFREARRGILKRFLERERLYFSDWGRDRFEATARANLAASIAALG